MHILWWLIAPVLAFRPDPAVHIGAEPTQLRRYHLEQQRAAKDGAAWVEFTAVAGQGWKARFNERTGRPHRAWGPPIALKNTTDLDGVEESLRNFFAAHPDLVGVDPDSLRIGKSGYVAHRDLWIVQFDQVVKGTDVTVWRAGVTARVQGGKLLMFGVSTEDVGLESVPSVPERIATQAAIYQGPAGNSAHQDVSAQPMVLPWRVGAELQMRLVWEVRSKTETPKGHWVSFVDGETGELLHVYNEVRFFAGKVGAQHDVRTPDGEMETSALQNMWVSLDEETIATDVDGQWDFEVDGLPSAQLRGEFLRVRNAGGDNAEFVLEDGNMVLTEADASQAELDVWVFQNQIRDWGLRFAPDLGIIHEELEAFVNIDENCNAYFDGDVNFMRAGQGCNNTGRIADVNYHEWGHGFHYYNLLSGVYDGSISEGIGDAIATLNTGDPLMAPHFWTSGQGIREVETNRVYPDDWVNEVHTDGLIFAGAVWDLWAELEAELGDEEEAYELVSTLLVEATRAGPEIPDAFDEFILADDDDGDLSNGTPHQCSIVRAFSQHGLGPGGNGSLLRLDHVPLGTQAPNVEVPIELQAENLAPQCVDASVEAAQVVYSVDGGESWESVDLDGDSSAMEGFIPGQASGTLVSYFLEIESSDGQVNTAPAGAEINPFTFYVGELKELYCEDFEASDGEYTHTLVSGNDEEGADDWQWGTPIGMGGDPDFAFSGNRVWGNDLGGGNYNGEYQNGKHNRLNSRAISVGDHTQLLLQYRRWLNVEDGFYDQARVLANGETVWTNHATTQAVGDEHHRDRQWAHHAVPIAADGSGSVSISWEIESDRGLSMGGWNIDDVCLYAVVGSADGDGALDGSAIQSDGEISISGAQCGCSNAGQSNSTGLAWMLLTGLLAAARRRER